MSKDPQKISSIEKIKKADKYLLICDNEIETTYSINGFNTKEIIAELETFKHKLLNESAINFKDRNI